MNVMTEIIQSQGGLFGEFPYYVEMMSTPDAYAPENIRFCVRVYEYSTHTKRWENIYTDFTSNPAIASVCYAQKIAREHVKQKIEEAN